MRFYAGRGGAGLGLSEGIVRVSWKLYIISKGKSGFFYGGKTEMGYYMHDLFTCFTPGGFDHLSRRRNSNGIGLHRESVLC